MSEAGSQELARADAGERLLDLPCRFRRSGAWIQERQHAREPILCRGHRAEEQRARRDAQGQEVPDLRPRREHHAAGEQRHEQRHREMRLEKDQTGHRHENDDERQHALLELAQLLTLFGGEHGAPHHDRELRELGGLQRQHAEVDPATRAIDRRRDGMREGQQRNNQQQRRDPEQRPRPTSPAMIVGAREHDREQAPDHRADRLPQREAGADLATGGRDETRRPVDRRQAEDDQDRGDDGEQPSFPRHSASTSRRNVAPRSSKFLNMS